MTATQERRTAALEAIAWLGGVWDHLHSNSDGVAIAHAIIDPTLAPNAIRVLVENAIDLDEAEAETVLPALIPGWSLLKCRLWWDDVRWWADELHVAEWSDHPSVADRVAKARQQLDMLIRDATS